MKRRRSSVIVIVVVLVLVGALLWMAPFTEDGPTPGADSKPQYLALISDSSSPVNRGQDNRLRLVYDDGSTSVTEEFPTSSTPEMVRYEDGFAMAAADEILVFDRAGRTTGYIATDSVASVSDAATSQSNSAVSFAFQAPVDSGHDNRVMTMVGGEVSYATTSSVPTGLTVCDDGTTRWLESAGGDDLVIRTMAPGREPESTEMDRSVDAVEAATFDCVTGDLTMVMNDEVPQADVDPVFRGTGVSPAGFITVNTDGSFRIIPLETGAEVIEGQFDIGGDTVVSVTIDGHEVLLAHVADGDDADLEISTFNIANPEESIHDVVVRDSARGLSTDTRDDFMGAQTATTVFAV